MIEGLKIVRQLKKTERFESFEAEYKGQRAFAKKALSDNTAVHLVFQDRNSRTVDNIGNDLLRSPKVLARSDDWIVTEWVGGESVESLIQGSPEEAARITAKVINIFDSQPNADTPLREIFTFKGLSERIEQRIDGDIRRPAVKLFEDSLELFRDLAPKLQACLQDADVQPEHLFIDPDKNDSYILIDSEHLNTHWPRYYDLANNYSKYWKRDNRPFAAQILREYLTVSGQSAEEIFEPLCASLIVRSFALHWEKDYDPGALTTNIPRSQELLRLVLQADSLNNLL